MLYVIFLNTKVFIYVKKTKKYRLLFKNIAIPRVFFVSCNKPEYSQHKTKKNAREQKRRLQYSTKSELCMFAHVIPTRGPVLFPQLAWKQVSVFT